MTTLAEARDRIPQLRQRVEELQRDQDDAAALSELTVARHELSKTIAQVRRAEDGSALVDAVREATPEQLAALEAATGLRARDMEKRSAAHIAPWAQAAIAQALGRREFELFPNEGTGSRAGAKVTNER